jgi:hypothetical protein
MIIKDFQLSDELWQSLKAAAQARQLRPTALMEELLVQALEFQIDQPKVKKLVIKGADLEALQTLLDKVISSPSELLQKLEMSHVLQIENGVPVRFSEDDLLALRHMAEGMNAANPEEYISQFVQEAVQTQLHGSPTF